MISETTNVLMNRLRLKNESDYYWGEIDTYGLIIHYGEFSNSLTAKIYFNSNERTEEINEYFESLNFQELIISFEIKNGELH